MEDIKRASTEFTEMVQWSIWNEEVDQIRKDIQTYPDYMTIRHTQRLLNVFMLAGQYGKSEIAQMLYCHPNNDLYAHDAEGNSSFGVITTAWPLNKELAKKIGRLSFGLKGNFCHTESKENYTNNSLIEMREKYWPK